MTQNQQFKVQAWIDGELPSAEAREVEAWVQSNPEARALADNLRGFHTTLRAHEPRPPVPESREFYWSKIARGIEPSSTLSPRNTESQADTWRGAFRWLGWLIPAGAAAVALLAFLRPDPLLSPTRHSPPIRMVGHVVEAPSDDITTLTFYSAQDSVTVVWVGNAEVF